MNLDKRKDTHHFLTLYNFAYSFIEVMVKVGILENFLAMVLRLYG